MIMQQQQLPMHGRQQQMHVPQGTMFQPRPQPSHVFRPQQMPGQPQLVPQQQQQPPQQQQQQPNATSDAAEQYWALQERMRDAYLPSLREIQRMHKGTVRGGQTVCCCCRKGLLSACLMLALFALGCCHFGCIGSQAMQLSLAESSCLLCRLPSVHSWHGICIELACIWSH